MGPGERQDSFQSGRQRRIKIKHNQARVCDHVSIVATEHHMAGAIENSVLVPGQRAFKEIITRLTVHKGIQISEYQALLRIGNIGIVIQGMKRLLQISLAHQITLVARGLNRLRCRQNNAGRILTLQPCVMAQRTERRGNDALRHALIGNARHIVGLHAT